MDRRINSCPVSCLFQPENCNEDPSNQDAFRRVAGVAYNTLNPPIPKTSNLMRDTVPLLSYSDFPKIERSRIDTLQVNLGYLCNLSCTHCHVNAGPTRTELMSRSTMNSVIEALKKTEVSVIDMTGGSPEMNPDFKYLVDAADELGVEIWDRCNPTILVEPGYEDLPAYFKQRRIKVIASLPCYSQQNVDGQRGSGVFERSIQGLKALNTLGYGHKDSGLIVDLVYNPDEPVLPPDQATLELEYKEKLFTEHQIVFNQLYVLANMPINRFGARLLARNQFDQYVTLLEDSYREANLSKVMCRSLVSVDHEGFIFDCDFNQMMGLNTMNGNTRMHIRDLSVKSTPREIRIGEHCYACTAGQGSSCGGSLQ